jgi:hypothetical protein
MKYYSALILACAVAALPQKKASFTRNLLKETGKGAMSTLSQVAVNGVGQIGSAVVQNKVNKIAYGGSSGMGGAPMGGGYAPDPYAGGGGMGAPM